MAAAQHHGMSINFHIGFAAQTAEANRALQAAVRDDKAVFVKESVMLFMSNADAIANVILSALCERFPKLNFVSVESWGELAALLAKLARYRATGAR